MVHSLRSFQLNSFIIVIYALYLKCNMYDFCLFNMLFIKFLLTQILGYIDGKQVVVNKMFI